MDTTPLEHYYNMSDDLQKSIIKRKKHHDAGFHDDIE